jgi:uncharacterized membrane protein
VLLAGAAFFLLWELYATVRWVREAGGIGNAFDHLYRTLRSDWMAQIVVSDHLVIAATVLVTLWIDAGRFGWKTGRRIFLALAFIGLGSPTLLAYLAWRLGRGSEGTTAG